MSNKNKNKTPNSQNNQQNPPNPPEETQNLPTSEDEGQAGQTATIAEEAPVNITQVSFADVKKKLNNSDMPKKKAYWIGLYPDSPHESFSLITLPLTLEQWVEPEGDYNSYEERDRTRKRGQIVWLLDEDYKKLIEEIQRYRCEWNIPFSKWNKDNKLKRRASVLATGQDHLWNYRPEGNENPFGNHAYALLVEDAKKLAKGNYFRDTLEPPSIVKREEWQATGWEDGKIKPIIPDGSEQEESFSQEDLLSLNR